MTGTLYGVGVGPGDPELVTIKAARLLGQVPVIAYAASLDGDSLARRIAMPHLASGQQEIPLPMSFAADRRETAAYDRGADAIAVALHAGRDVAALCEGDPLLYGSFIPLLARLGERFAVQIIPGVTSLTACAALARRPLAARDEALVVVPATRPAEELERLLGGAEAAVIVKLGRHLDKVRLVLDRLMLTPHAVCIERAGQPGQQIRPVAALGDNAVPYFSLILVRKQ